MNGYWRGRTDQRILSKGVLGPDTTFEIIVSGKVSSYEIATLIRKLKVDLDLLTEDAPRASVDPAEAIP